MLLSASEMTNLTVRYVPRRAVAKLTMPRLAWLTPRDLELTNSCRKAWTFVFPISVGRETSRRNVAPGLVSPASAAAVEATGELVAVKETCLGFATASAATPCVRTLVAGLSYFSVSS